MSPFQFPALPAGSTVDFDSFYTVEAGQALGTYLFQAYIGNYPDESWDSSAFTFDIIEDTSFVNPQHNEIIDNFTLRQNYPNPFNPTTTISYYLPNSGHAILQIYNPLGQHIRTLASGWHQPGTYRVTFDASELSSGIYFYSLQAGSFTNTQKMVLLK